MFTTADSDCCDGDHVTLPPPPPPSSQSVSRATSRRSRTASSLPVVGGRETLSLRRDAEFRDTLLLPLLVRRNLERSTHEFSKKTLRDTTLMVRPTFLFGLFLNASSVSRRACIFFIYLFLVVPVGFGAERVSLSFDSLRRRSRRIHAVTSQRELVALLLFTPLERAALRGAARARRVLTLCGLFACRISLTHILRHDVFHRAGADLRGGVSAVFWFYF